MKIERKKETQRIIYNYKIETCDLCGDWGKLPNFEDAPEEFIMLTGKQFLCYKCRRE